jgi:hypothetical protein
LYRLGEDFLYLCRRFLEVGHRKSRVAQSGRGPVASRLVRRNERVGAWE